MSETPGFSPGKMGTVTILRPGRTHCVIRHPLHHPTDETDPHFSFLISHFSFFHFSFLILDSRGSAPSGRHHRHDWGIMATLSQHRSSSRGLPGPHPTLHCIYALSVCQIVGPYMPGFAEGRETTHHLSLITYHLKALAMRDPDARRGLFFIPIPRRPAPTASTATEATWSGRA